MKCIKRNDPCPCGSGKKYKKCCIYHESSNLQYDSWIDNKGIHVCDPELPNPSPKQLKLMTKEYQKLIRNSPIWDEMVKKHGKEEAKKLLKEFKAEVR